MRWLRVPRKVQGCIGGVSQAQDDVAAEHASIGAASWELHSVRTLACLAGRFGSWQSGDVLVG